MTIVVSAGNVIAPANPDSVATPATAKNVIAVGSTDNYRPSTEAGSPPLLCPVNGVTTQEANNISEVSGFSARGKTIGTTLGSDVRSVRVTPDLVAPGGRTESAVPYQVPTIYHCPICRQYWPDPVTGYHSFNQGTSFSAPVVSGVAALTRKWLLDRGASSPAPSLVKAALIATADDIGSGSVDHRPSNMQGWGRVSLGRLSDPAAKFYVNDNLGLAVGTGQERTWTRTIDDPSKPTYVVLVWSDPPSAVSNTNSQVPLVNDLRLRVDGNGFAKFWFGNTFRENTGGVDDGLSRLFTTTSDPPADTINTVEAIFIPPNTFQAGQQVIVRVSGTNVPNGPQKFAVFGYNVRLNS